MSEPTPNLVQQSEDRERWVATAAGRSPGESMAFRTRFREFVLHALSITLRLTHPVTRKIRRLCWAAEVRASVCRMGAGVYVYGPIRFLGSREVWLGGSGNLYDNVLFETVAPARISVGDGFRINRGCLISAHAGITIGDNCLIGEYVSIRDNNHVFDDTSVPIGEQGFRASPITIDDDVWIGRGAAILQGVSIGRGAVIGANSVVTKDVPDHEVWAGIPARFLRHRKKGDSG
ncbi:MAG: acyltransferase [Planctomycetes bacterium]|nr:acyltransferase [Planctomycetota bacterium]